jgi:hypothetical protein
MVTWVYALEKGADLAGGPPRLRLYTLFFKAAFKPAEARALIAYPSLKAANVFFISSHGDILPHYKPKPDQKSDNNAQCHAEHGEE